MLINFDDPESAHRSRQDPFADGRMDSDLDDRYVTKSAHKNRVLAGLLGIFLGGLGIHNLYLGYFGRGITQLLLSVLSFGALLPIVEIWGFIEGIEILIGAGRYRYDGQDRDLD